MFLITSFQNLFLFRVVVTLPDLSELPAKESSFEAADVPWLRLYDRLLIQA